MTIYPIEVDYKPSIHTESYPLNIRRQHQIIGGHERKIRNNNRDKSFHQLSESGKRPKVIKEDTVRNKV